MGKSLDLPDPLESAPNKPLANADDLLAQLAGEEVDRLLAEADAEGKQKSAAAPDTSAPAPVEPEAAIQNQLDALFSEITTAQPTPSSAPAAPAPAPVPVSAPAPVAPIGVPPIGPVATNLPADVNPDEVLAAILGEPGKMGKLPDFTPPPTPPTALLAAHAALAAPAETSAAERAALVKADPADELPGPGELDALTGPIDDDGPLPIYLKPLEWLNAPLELLPSTARDVLGQAAILTLVNAIAVLIYVFVFRKH
jgi:hypothetical protein